ncbi:protein disulfide isomerase [Sistotremastrum suecicum HHB10207 ss-3]|uniref:Protein disulfide-isomerase n=1 Tax=Sistotremastrum suecicum HHB10207 ss-3 TaxID=1314776 RepID=A0A166EIS8_9AGAM|nr:protein disulfide isomerase [Sistotremastrum suecicum HHB10207 ss-3]
MRLSLVSSAVLLGVASFAVANDAPSEVIDLTAQNFESLVNPEPLILVEFFAPWCGHCKALAPHYDEASVTLKPQGIKLAKVDCVDQAELCQQHGVSGYPTLKVFRNGTPTDYSGPRKADGIVSYMVKQSLPAISDVTSANFEEFKAADKVVAIAFVSSPDSIPAFAETAELHRDDLLFGTTSDPEVIKAAGVTPPALVLYRSFDEPQVVYSGSVSSATTEDLENFIQENSVPLLDELSAENYAIYSQAKLPLAYLFIVPTDPKREQYIEAIKPLAKKFKGKLSFVSIDATKYGDHGKALNLQEEKWPSFVIQDLVSLMKFPLDQDLGLDLAKVTEHTEAYVAGTLQPSLKSQPIPESQDESVYTLVGKEFDSVVFDDEKDVFLEFYASWCGHCKRLKPIWDDLGSRYEAIKDRLTIAKMEATENDLPPSVPFRVGGFPTLKFKPAGSRDFIDYEGDRSLESLIEFVESNAKNPLDPAVPFKGQKTASAKITAQTPAEHHDEL